MYDEQNSLGNRDDTDHAVRSLSNPGDGLSSETMDESGPASPLGNHALCGFFCSGSASGSDSVTRLGTPPPWSASISDEISVTSSRTPSIYTFDSSGNAIRYSLPMDDWLHSKLRDLHGRTYNSTNQAYLLPADDAEQDRLDMQHRSLYHFVGGLFPWPERVDPHLVPSDTHRPAILDIGTGSGTWVLDMGRKYPHADIIGIDLVPPLVDVKFIPENCRFEIDDANLSMIHYASTFDFVHMRAADSGIHDFESFLYNVAQVLKSGAEMVLSCGDYHVYNEHRQLLPSTGEGRPGFSWFNKYFSAFIDTWRRKGSFMDAQFNWERWLRANPNFEDIKLWDLWIPVGPWPPDMTPEHVRASLLFRSNAINMIDSCKAALLEDGYPKNVVENWQRESKRELVEMKTKLHVKWRWTIFRRTQQAWIPQHQVSPEAITRDE
ncbi:hypothetical protein FRB99_006739 [Tulasnella sp. 403]|nr:hypothetical protein FRB99_006739 [Tulasnella sp. 403]